MRWRFHTEGDVWASPALGADGTVHFVGWDERDWLFAVHHNVSLRWKVAMAEEHLLDDVSVGPDGTVYCYDLRTALYAVNPDSTLRWSHPIPHGTEGGGNMVLWAASGTEGTIYSGSNEGLYALNPDGTSRWMRRTRSGARSPIVSADETIFFATGDELLAIDAGGELRWSFDDNMEGYDGPHGCPAIGADGTVFFLSSTGLYALNGEPRRERYDSSLSLPIIPSILVAIVVLGYWCRRRSRRTATGTTRRTERAI